MNFTLLWTDFSAGESVLFNQIHRFDSTYTLFNLSNGQDIFPILVYIDELNEH